MKSRVIAIGDIHGSIAAFVALLDAIAPTAGDTVVILGDCVDRGPDSRGVIEMLLTLEQKCHLVALLGNHEEMMIDHLDGQQPRFDWLPFGGQETLESYRSSSGVVDVDTKHLDYIRSWRNFYEHDTHFFVHGGYDARKDLGEQTWNVWRWHSLRTNVPPPHVSGKTAVVGHTSLKDAKILDLGHVICIDTYCYGGGRLTALDVTSGQVWQADRDGRQVQRTDLPPIRHLSNGERQHAIAANDSSQRNSDR